MIGKPIRCSAHEYIVKAEKINKENQHENLGFLSFERGFMPIEEPEKKLPYPFSMWDSLASNLPVHYKNQTLRQSIKELPLLDASELPEKYLCRASMLLSMLAHAYVRNERQEDLNIPEVITIPWKIVSKRLKRPQPFLSYIDLIIYNWKLKDPNGNLEVENLNLLIPTVNNQEENIFYLTQTEIAFRTKDTIKGVVDIQNGIVNNELENVIKGLKHLTKVINEVTKTSFLKINPNPRSKNYVDPVVWAKTVAPFAVPLKEGVQGPSGTASPFFHLIDTFLERARYDTILGEEALFIREWYPEHWRNFIEAVAEVSILDYIKKENNEELNGAFYDFIECYSGDQGFLGVHRRKVYGFLQMAFKVGRSVTIGGFSGLFKERTWEEVDDELETTRLERYVNKELKCPYAGVRNQSTIGEDSAKNIILDVGNKGLSYQHGDRCAIIPKNIQTKVEELIGLLDVAQNLEINLNKEWKEYIGINYNDYREKIPLKNFLAFADLSDASGMFGMCSHIEHFFQVKEGVKLSFEDLILQLKKLNMDVNQFVIPHLASILNPLEQRLYSISSVKEDSIQLTVGNGTKNIEGKEFKGVASSYLHSQEVNADSQIPMKIIRPLRFSLPKTKLKSINIFAGGSGIAPFKAFWEELGERGELLNLAIYYSVKYEQDIAFKEELLDLFLHSGVKLNIIISRENKMLDSSASMKAQKMKFVETTGRHIDTLMFQSNNKSQLFDSILNEEAYFYSCGKAGFALNVMQSLKEIIITEGLYSESDAHEIYYSLFSDDRFMQDVFTSPADYRNDAHKEFYISEIIAHNNPQHGYWVAIDDAVYDLTEFKEIHPGGVKIVEDNAGRDATHEFRRANHHQSKEITSMLNMYFIGRLKQISLPNENVERRYKFWLDNLHLATEMQNTFNADFSFKNRKSTIECQDTEITPYKVAMMIENQNRFLSEYVKNIKLIFNELIYDQALLAELESLLVKLLDSNLNFNISVSSLPNEGLEKRWLELEKLELKYKSILNAVREMLWEGVKVFEACSENKFDELDMFLSLLAYKLKDDLFAMSKQEINKIPSRFLENNT